MYNPEEDIIPPELLEQALQSSQVSSLYKVYFDKDNGNILSITNEENQNFLNSIEIEYELVKGFFTGKQISSNYKVVFIDQTTPTIVSKNDVDVNIINIEEIPRVEHWDSMFTIENYPLQHQWGFQLRPDQRNILKEHNLNTAFEVFVVDKDHNNFLIRSLKILLKDIIDADRIYIQYESKKEENIENRIFVRKFFSTVGYQILYDTNS
jgi:hypothetical protein